VATTWTTTFRLPVGTGFSVYYFQTGSEATILDRETRWRCVVTFTLWSTITLVTTDWVCPEVILDMVMKRKNSSSPENRILGQ